jgi:hypothetical protein
VRQLALLDDGDELAGVTVLTGPGAGPDGDPPEDHLGRPADLDVDGRRLLALAELLDGDRRGGRRGRR